MSKLRSLFTTRPTYLSSLISCYPQSHWLETLTSPFLSLRTLWPPPTSSHWPLTPDSVQAEDGPTLSSRPTWCASHVLPGLRGILVSWPVTLNCSLLLTILWANKHLRRGPSVSLGPHSVNPALIEGLEPPRYWAVVERMNKAHYSKSWDINHLGNDLYVNSDIDYTTSSF